MASDTTSNRDHVAADVQATLVLADTNKLVLGGMRDLITSQEHRFTVVATTTDLAELDQIIVSQEPHLCLIEVQLLIDGAGPAEETLRDLAKRTDVLITAEHITSADLLTMLGARARGVVLKDDRPEKVLQAIAGVIEDRGHFIDPRLSGTVIDATRIGQRNAGEPFGLTIQERRAVQRLPEGLTNAEIARDLGLSGHTVKQHLRSAYGKMGAFDRIHAARIVEEHSELSRRARPRPKDQ